MNATAVLIDASSRTLGEIRPVPPAGPAKDYSDVYLPILGVTGACILLAVGLVLWGWRRRRRSQSHVAAPQLMPESLYELEPRAASEGMYVATVFGRDRLDRVAAHRLGVRSHARLEVHTAGEHPGVAILRPRVENLFIPAEDVTDAGAGSGMVGKFVEPDGLLLVSWRLGEDEVTTGFRPRDPADRARVLESLRALRTTRETTAVEGGSGRTPETAGQEHTR